MAAKTFPHGLIISGVIELFASEGGIDDGVDGKEMEKVQEDFRGEAKKAASREAEVASGGLKEGEADIVFEVAGKMTEIGGDEFVVDSFDVLGDLEG